eukprot:scaffold42260_cov61-Phaeocystis_antarctica.AAC.1
MVMTAPWPSNAAHPAASEDSAGLGKTSRRTPPPPPPPPSLPRRVARSARAASTRSASASACSAASRWLVSHARNAPTVPPSASASASGASACGAARSAAGIFSAKASHSSTALSRAASRPPPPSAAPSLPASVAQQAACSTQRGGRGQGSGSGGPSTPAPQHPAPSTQHRSQQVESKSNPSPSLTLTPKRARLERTVVGTRQQHPLAARTAARAASAASAATGLLPARARREGAQRLCTPWKHLLPPISQPELDRTRARCRRQPRARAARAQQQQQQARQRRAATGRAAAGSKDLLEVGPPHQRHHVAALQPERRAAAGRAPHQHLLHREGVGQLIADDSAAHSHRRQAAAACHRRRYRAAAPPLQQPPHLTAHLARVRTDDRQLGVRHEARVRGELHVAQRGRALSYHVEQLGVHGRPRVTDAQQHVVRQHASACAELYHHEGLVAAARVTVAGLRRRREPQ